MNDQLARPCGHRRPNRDGSIGKGTLPLIERHFSYDKTRLVVIDPDDSDREILDARGVRFIHQAVARENYRDLLRPL